MSDRPFWLESFYEPEITDSDEPSYPIPETHFAEKRPILQPSDDHDGRQEGPHSEEEQEANKTVKTAPLDRGERKQDDKESKDRNQQHETQEGENRRETEGAKPKKKDKDEEPHEDDTKSEIRSGLTWVTNTVNGPHNEKRSVPLGTSNKVPLPKDPEGKELELSSSTWGEEQGN